MPAPQVDPSPDGRDPTSTPRSRERDHGASVVSRDAGRAGVPGEFELRAGRHGSTHTISLSGELDLATAAVVHDELVAAETTDAQRILLDLSGLSFLDSTGLRVIIQADRRSRADGDRLKLLRGPPQVQRIFEITATIDTLPFTD